MKKVLLVAAVAMVFGLVGCSKKVDCKCTITTSMDGEVVGTTESTYLDVEDGCDKVSVNQEMEGMTQTMSCEEI